jgi:hypothetical protein
MNKLLSGFLAGGMMLWGGLASAAPSATVVLNGASFLQSFSVLNTSTAGENIIGAVYSFGTAADGIATWDSSTGGGVASDFLSDPRWFQTVTFGPLAVAPSGSFLGSGLDIDLIQTLVPLDVTGGIIDNVGTSLANGLFRVNFSTGASGQASLNQTGWQVSQTLQINGGHNAVPEPASLLLLGSGVIGLGLWARRRAS